MDTSFVSSNGGMVILKHFSRGFDPTHRAQIPNSKYGGKMPWLWCEAGANYAALAANISQWPCLRSKVKTCGQLDFYADFR